MTTNSNGGIVTIHYTLHTCPKCMGDGWIVPAGSSEDIRCSHRVPKFVRVAPEVVERERLASEQEEREFSARMGALLDTL